MTTTTMTRAEKLAFVQENDWARMDGNGCVNFDGLGNPIELGAPRDNAGEFDGSFKTWPMVGGHKILFSLFNREEKDIYNAAKGRSSSSKPAVKTPVKMFASLIKQVEEMREELELSDKQVEKALMYVWSLEPNVQASTELLEKLGFECTISESERSLLKKFGHDIPSQWDYNSFKDSWKK